tara:strand:+ start:11380 stop:12060 length:681 start_codon:yes stop_codon:yes gene_type:complete
MVSITPVEPQGINQLLIDATLRIDHNYVNRPSEYPVEDGSIITDHVRQSPENLTLEIVTTNSPIVVNVDESGNTQIRTDQSNRKQLAFNTWLEFAGYEINKQEDKFEQQVNEPQLLNIITGLKVYTNMLITNLVMPENQSIGEALIASVSFQKIKRARTQFFTVPAVSELNGKAPNIDNQATPNTDLGKQKAEEVPDNSTLFNITVGDIQNKKANQEAGIIRGAQQ